MTTPRCDMAKKNNDNDNLPPKPPESPESEQENSGDDDDDPWRHGDGDAQSDDDWRHGDGIVGPFDDWRHGDGLSALGDWRHGDGARGLGYHSDTPDLRDFTIKHATKRLQSTHHKALSKSYLLGTSKRSMPPDFNLLEN